jgi:hypothetical protein
MACPQEWKRSACENDLDSNRKYKRSQLNRVSRTQLPVDRFLRVYISSDANCNNCLEIHMILRTTPDPLLE